MKSPLHYVGRGFRGGANITHAITLPISMTLACLSALGVCVGACATCAPPLPLRRAALPEHPGPPLRLPELRMRPMYKVNVSVPAVSTNVGPGFDVLGLALNLRNVVELSLRADDRLDVHVEGEGQEALALDVTNPAMRAAVRLFQELEQAPAGLNVRCANRIPYGVGLSARVSLAVGGLVGANNLLGGPLSHDALVRMAVELTGDGAAVVAAISGGLSVCSAGAGGPIYRTVPIRPLRAVIAVPRLPDFQPRLRADLPARVTMSDAIHNIGHAALVIEALRLGDFKLLREALSDRLHEPYRRQHIPAYPAIVAAAEDAGAVAVTLCGAGPALLAFATYNHESIEQAMQRAFRAAGIEARTWSLPSDQQGVVISVVQ